MCGICGAFDLTGRPIPDLERRLEVMNALIAHRGPDDVGVWVHPHGHVGLAHRRLSIIDLEHGRQPMGDENDRWITYNGEIYNYPELRREIGADRFRTTCDTEVALRAHERWGTDGLNRLRGMFAYALWDEPAGRADPASATVSGSSRSTTPPSATSSTSPRRPKALLPFLPAIETDLDALKDYLTFQFCLAGKTLFKGIDELLPGHFMRLGRGSSQPVRYWEVYYELDFEHTARYFEEQVEALLRESVDLHLRSDVPVAAYLSGGLDSSVVASAATAHADGRMQAFTGKFSEDERYDESRYARALAEWRGLELHEIDIDRRRLRRPPRRCHLPPRLPRRRARARSRSTWSLRRRVATAR